MALKDVKSLSAEISREYLEEIIIGLGKSVNQYVYTPIPEEATLDDFFYAFREGDRKLDSTRFFVQRRIKPRGRIAIRYSFNSNEDKIGRVGFSVMDNCEDIPQELFDEVYSTLRSYIEVKKLKILEETIKPEY